MPTIWVREFSGGLDARRLPETSAGGTLLRGVNGHINRGGEFEQRSDFVKQHDLPLGRTRGLVPGPGGVTVFGHAQRPSDLPSEIQYQRLEHPTGEALDGVLFSTTYGGRLLVTARFEDGSHHLFYDGARVTDGNAPPNASAADKPLPLLTFQQKAFVGAGATLYSSAVGKPADFTDAGSSVIDMSTHAEGAETLTGLARYDQFLAVFSADVVQIWFVDPDPNLTRQAQVLNNTGTAAPRSVTQFGDGDVFYLGRTGIRSLRARDSSNSAATTDVGSAIDPLTLRAIDGLTPEELARATGIMEPREGRFWLLLGGTIYVFSYFTASKISAWTTYDPGFPVDALVVQDNTVWLRSGDALYTFGDRNGRPVYSADTVPECWTPYLDADEPFREKAALGVDVAVRGEWEVRFAFDPQNEAASDRIGHFAQTTYGIGNFNAAGHFNHISVRLRGVAPAAPDQPAVISAIVVHFERNAEEDS